MIAHESGKVAPKKLSDICFEFLRGECSGPCSHGRTHGKPGGREFLEMQNSKLSWGVRGLHYDDLPETENAAEETTEHGGSRILL